MRAEKMRGFDGADLQRQALDAREQLFRIRFQMGMGQAEGLKKYRNLKKDRARMLTVLREKELGGEVLPELPAPKPVVEKKKRSLLGKRKPTLADKKKPTRVDKKKPVLADKKKSTLAGKKKAVLADKKKPALAAKKKRSKGRDSK